MPRVSQEPRPVRRRRQAGALALVTSVLWAHQWLAALLVVGFVSWLVVHTRLEGALGRTLLRYWRRAWPPRPGFLVSVLGASTLAYAVHVPLPASLLPIGLNVLALSLLLPGNGDRSRDPVSRGPLAVPGTPDGGTARRGTVHAARLAVVLALMTLIMGLEVALGGLLQQ